MNKTPWQYFIYCWKNSFNYQGRARRAELGWFALISLAIVLLLLVLNTLIYIKELSLSLDLLNEHWQPQIGLRVEFAFIFILVSLLPLIAVLTRRIHDLNKGFCRLLPFLLLLLLPIGLSALPVLLVILPDDFLFILPFAFISFISDPPFVLIFASFYFIYALASLLFQEGEPEPNRFGNSPKPELTQ